jgi:hypothetical protein
MKFPVAVVLTGAALFAGPVFSTEQDSLQEKISDTSPDKRFAVRTSYDAAIDDGSGEEINREAIRSVDIIAVADKKVVANLIEQEGEEAHIVGHIKWSPDSKWFAYALSEGHRVTETSVFHWNGDKFEAVDTEHLNVPAGGDPRNQYINPVRWLKPGTLVLEQFTIFFYGKGESTYQFTVRFDEKGKFRVIDRKKVRHKNE